MEKRTLVLKGRLWVLSRDGELISDIDTDMIYHNAHLAVTDVSKMGQYAFGNLKGYEEFAKQARPGDMVLAGANFGSGSSMQHAVDCFKALGVQAVIARSFGAIYKRNAINSALPVLEIPALADKAFAHFEQVEIDLGTGTLRGPSGSVQGKPMSGVARDIYMAGGLFEFGSGE